MPRPLTIYEVVLTDFFYSLSTQIIHLHVLVVSVGVEFRLTGLYSTQLNFPSGRNSLSPVKLAVEVINIFFSLHFSKRRPVPCF